MSNIPFSSSYLLQLIRASFPQVDDKTHQLLKTPHDAIAILVHACMLSVGFRLVGHSEDDNIETPSDESEPKPLCSNWNSPGGSYGFRYSHTQSPREYLVKINRLGGKIVINGMELGDDKISSFDITTKDFTSETFFPFTMDDTATKKLADIFISEDRIGDLANLVKSNIVQKLMPGLYTEEEKLRESAGERALPACQQPQTNIDRDPPHVPRENDNPYGIPRLEGGRSSIPPVGEVIPGFDDEYEIIQPRRGYTPGGRNPLSIGADDLNPPGLGPNPPLRGPFFGEEGGMSGMHPTADHPMFGGRGNGGGMRGGLRAPPGARYDPVTPGDEPPTGRLRGPRGPGGPPFGGSGPYNPFSSFSSGDFM
ncbi:PI31 proteasome regulator N-terminal-domain-containing protein [Trichophaea hybrida]|nr:PI31 proteasome regulator N-terminal-domain-containing protein [Trichophaea hybrida]